jgi:hypothetical protein
VFQGSKALETYAFSRKNKTQKGFLHSPGAQGRRNVKQEGLKRKQGTRFFQDRFPVL